MIVVGAFGSRFGDRQGAMDASLDDRRLRGFALALLNLGVASLIGTGWPLAANVFVLGFANGVFAVSAIGSMMGLAGAGRKSREGVRMGVWGAAQAGAFAIGGFLGAVGVGALRGVLHHTASAFLLVFCVEALVFLISAVLAGRLESASSRSAQPAGPGAIEFGGAPG